MHNVAEPAREKPGHLRFLPLLALACGLALAGCSSTGSAWDSVFGDSSDEADAGPEGLQGVTQRPDYEQNTSRKQPVSRYALVSPEKNTREKTAPEKNTNSVIEQQPVPAPAGMESRAPAPLAAAVSGEASAPAEPPVSPPVSGADDISAVPAFVPVAAGCAGAGMETTVIGGDGRVSIVPAPPDDCGAGQGADVSSLVATIQFASSSASLTDADRRVLRDVVRMQKSYGGVVRVVGHASSRTANMTQGGHSQVNLDISSRRANAVGAALVSMGVSPGMILVTAASDQQPVYQEVMPSGEAGNRRAEIYLDSVSRMAAMR